MAGLTANKKRGNFKSNRGNRSMKWNSEKEYLDACEEARSRYYKTSCNISQISKALKTSPSVIWSMITKDDAHKKKG